VRPGVQRLLPCIHSRQSASASTPMDW
jgi:hypothetical protein